MENFSAILQTVWRPAQKNSWGGVASTPLTGRGLERHKTLPDYYEYPVKTPDDSIQPLPQPELFRVFRGYSVTYRCFGEYLWRCYQNSTVGTLSLCPTPPSYSISPLYSIIETPSYPTMNSCRYARGGGGLWQVLLGVFAEVGIDSSAPFFLCVA